MREWRAPRLTVADEDDFETVRSSGAVGGEVVEVALDRGDALLGDGQRGALEWVVVHAHGHASPDGLHLRVRTFVAHPHPSIGQRCPPPRFSQPPRFVL